MLTLAAVARLWLYVGATLVTGWAVLSVQPGAATRLRASASAKLLALGAIALVGAVAGLLEAQRRAMELPWVELPPFVGESQWGQHWLQLAIMACVASAVTLVATRSWSAWVGVVASAGLAITMSGLGHSNADDQFPVLARAVDAVHVLAMGSWIGGLTFTLLLSRADDHALWRAMSRVATIAAPLALLSGAGSAVRMLRAVPVSALLPSSYGQLLALKIVLALGILAIGAAQRRRVERGAIPARRAVGQELVIAAGVMVLTAVLTGTEPPG